MIRPMLIPSTWLEMPSLPTGATFGVPIPNDLSDAGHVKGDPKCPSCWWHLPDPCPCGHGLTHYAPYDSFPVGDGEDGWGDEQIISAELCDSCGRNYR